MLPLPVYMMTIPRQHFPQLSRQHQNHCNNSNQSQGCPWEKSTPQVLPNTVSFQFGPEGGLLALHLVKAVKHLQEVFWGLNCLIAGMETAYAYPIQVQLQQFRQHSPIQMPKPLSAYCSSWWSKSWAELQPRSVLQKPIFLQRFLVIRNLVFYTQSTSAVISGRRFLVKLDPRLTFFHRKQAWADPPFPSHPHFNDSDIPFSHQSHLLTPRPFCYGLPDLAC